MRLRGTSDRLPIAREHCLFIVRPVELDDEGGGGANDEDEDEPGRMDDEDKHIDTAWKARPAECGTEALSIDCPLLASIVFIVRPVELDDEGGGGANDEDEDEPGRMVDEDENIDTAWKARLAECGTEALPADCPLRASIVERPRREWWSDERGGRAKDEDEDEPGSNGDEDEDEPALRKEAMAESDTEALAIDCTSLAIFGSRGANDEDEYEGGDFGDEDGDEPGPKEDEDGDEQGSRKRAMALSSSICALGRRPLSFGTDTCVVSIACQTATRIRITGLCLSRTPHGAGGLLQRTAAAGLSTGCAAEPMLTEPHPRPAGRFWLLDDSNLVTIIRLKSWHHPCFVACHWASQIGLTIIQATVRSDQQQQQKQLTVSHLLFLSNSATSVLRF